MRADGRPHLVLVVDDDPDIRDVLQAILADEGFRVQVAGDGAAALDLATSNTPDLILLDLVMPLFDAADFCRTYRDAGGRAPIVLITAADSAMIDGATVACRAAGAIAKPFAIDEVLEMVARLLPA
jgi:DNA-binding response OmpR family regulator